MEGSVCWSTLDHVGEKQMFLKHNFSEIKWLKSYCYKAYAVSTNWVPGGHTLGRGDETRYLRTVTGSVDVLILLGSNGETMKV